MIQSRYSSKSLSSYWDLLHPVFCFQLLQKVTLLYSGILEVFITEINFRAWVTRCICHHLILFFPTSTRLIILKYFYGVFPQGSVCCSTQISHSWVVPLQFTRWSSLIPYPYLRSNFIQALSRLVLIQLEVVIFVWFLLVYVFVQHFLKKNYKAIQYPSLSF